MNRTDPTKSNTPARLPLSLYHPRAPQPNLAARANAVAEGALLPPPAYQNSQPLNLARANAVAQGALLPPPAYQNFQPLNLARANAAAQGAPLPPPAYQNSQPLNLARANAAAQGAPLPPPAFQNFRSLNLPPEPQSPPCPLLPPDSRLCNGKFRRLVGPSPSLPPARARVSLRPALAARSHFVLPNLQLPAAAQASSQPTPPSASNNSTPCTPSPVRMLIIAALRNAPLPSPNNSPLSQPVSGEPSPDVSPPFPDA
jgi:hypothetical protein